MGQITEKLQQILYKGSSTVTIEGQSWKSNISSIYKINQAGTSWNSYTPSNLYSIVTTLEPDNFYVISSKTVPFNIPDANVDGSFSSTVIDSLKGLDPITGETINWIETSTWFDGSPMDLSKVDSILYIYSNNKYYRRALSLGMINMSWYLNPDGETDNADAWDTFLAYIGKQGGNKQTPVNCVFPRGRYYSSRTTKFNGVKINFHFQGSEFAYPAGVRMWQFYSNYSNDFSFYGKLKLIALGSDSEDGMLYSNDPKIATFLYNNKINASEIRNTHNVSMQTILDSNPPIKIPSFDPLDYVGHGIYTTAVLRIPELEVYGATGCGIFYHAPAIGIKNEEAPDGYDCSMSNIGYGRFKGCRGPGVAALGPDANQISIFRVDTREGSTMGILDASQSGMQILHNHSAVNTWGDYWMVCNGDWTLIGAYAEVNTKVRSIYNGHGTVIGGPLNTNVAYSGDGNSGQIRGASASFTLDSLSTRGNIDILTSDKYHSLNIKQQDPDKVNISYGIGGESFRQDLMQIVDGKSRLNDGSTTTIPTVAFNKGLIVAGKYETSADGFNPRADIKWTTRSIIGNRLYNGTNVESWKCTGAGLYGNTYESLVGVTVANLVGSDGTISYQGLVMNGISDYFSNGDIIILNGNFNYIVTPVIIVNGNTQFSVGQPVDLGGKYVMPSVPIAKFRAIGKGQGLSNQRPSESSWTNAEKEANLGWSYFAEDTGVESVYTLLGWKTITYS